MIPKEDFWNYLLVYWHVFHSRQARNELRDLLSKYRHSDASNTFSHLLAWCELSLRQVNSNVWPNGPYGYSEPEALFWFNPRNMMQIFPKPKSLQPPEANKIRRNRREIFYPGHPFNNMVRLAPKLQIFKDWEKHGNLLLDGILEKQAMEKLSANIGISSKRVDFLGWIYLSKQHGHSIITVGIGGSKDIENMVKESIQNRKENISRINIPKRTFGKVASRKLDSIISLSLSNRLPWINGEVLSIQEHLRTLTRQDAICFMKDIIREHCIINAISFSESMGSENQLSEDMRFLHASSVSSNQIDLEKSTFIFLPIINNSNAPYDAHDYFRVISNEIFNSGSDSLVFVSNCDYDECKAAIEQIIMSYRKVLNYSLAIVNINSLLDLLSNYPWIWSKHFKGQYDFEIVKASDDLSLKGLFCRNALSRIVPVDKFIHPSVNDNEFSSARVISIEGKMGAGKTIAAYQLIKKHFPDQIVFWIGASSCKQYWDILKRILLEANWKCIIVIDDLQKHESLFPDSILSHFHILPDDAVDKMHFLLMYRSTERQSCLSLINHFTNHPILNEVKYNIDLDSSTKEFNPMFLDYCIQTLSKSFPMEDHEEIFDIDDTPLSIISIVNAMATSGESIKSIIKRIGKPNRYWEYQYQVLSSIDGNAADILRIIAMYRKLGIDTLPQEYLWEYLQELHSNNRRRTIDVAEYHRIIEKLRELKWIYIGTDDNYIYSHDAQINSGTTELLKYSYILADYELLLNIIIHKQQALLMCYGAQVFIRLSGIFNTMGNIERAMTILEECIERYPGLYPLHLQICLYLRAEERYEDELAFIEKHAQGFKKYVFYLIALLDLQFWTRKKHPELEPQIQRLYDIAFEGIPNGHRVLHELLWANCFLLQLMSNASLISAEKEIELREDLYRQMDEQQKKAIELDKELAKKKKSKKGKARSLA